MAVVSSKASNSVHLNEIALLFFFASGCIPETMGPRWVDLIVISFSFPDLSFIVSFFIVRGTHSPSK